MLCPDLVTRPSRFGSRLLVAKIYIATFNNFKKAEEKSEFWNFKKKKKRKALFSLIKEEKRIKKIYHRVWHLRSYIIRNVQKNPPFRTNYSETWICNLKFFDHRWSMLIIKSLPFSLIIATKASLRLKEWLPQQMKKSACYYIVFLSFYAHPFIM